MTGPSPELPIAVGILTDDHGRVLIQRRPDGAYYGGWWEFPGGKVHPSETLEGGLHRELHEELGVSVSAARPLIRIRHAYEDRRVRLDVWKVTSYRAVPRPREGQVLRWASPSDLNDYKMLPADGPVIHALRLPDVCLITADAPSESGAFLSRLERCLDQGIRLVQLRVRREQTELEQLARKAAALCAQAGAILVLNGEPEQALAWGAQGVHLNRERLAQYRQRPVPDDFWLSAACHNEAELEAAGAIGADFVLASPVASTASHPGEKTLGFDGLRGLCDSANIPVYALGGMNRENLDDAWKAGAQGVAGIRAFWFSA